MKCDECGKLIKEYWWESYECDECNNNMCEECYTENDGICIECRPVEND